MELKLSKICHDPDGFEALVDLWDKTKDCFIEDINLDMSGTKWFDADMCAPFGAVLYHLGEELNTIKLVNLRPDVERILSKNAFLSYYGREKVPDQWGTTITYQRFESKDDRYFANYIENELVQRQQIPNMSTGLKKKFRESIFEIFSNSVLHSGTELGIFSCGQFYPNRHMLDFSIVDLGIGIRANVERNTGESLTSDKAIVWATEGRNTTKKGNIPGGLGLKLLKEFIDLNKGSIQIVSDSGYWQRKDGKTTTTQLSHAFPGTVVTIEINTADSRSYALASELRSSEIF